MERSSLAAEGAGEKEEEDSQQHMFLLNVVKEKLSNIPHDEKFALVHVQRIRPELVDDEHILQFLRVENFDVDVSYSLCWYAILV